MQRYLSVFLIVALFGIGIPTVVRSIHRRMVGVAAGVTLQGRDMEYYYQQEARIVAQQFARELQRAPVNATIHKETGELIKEQVGIFVDVEATVELVMRAKAHSELEVVKIGVLPEVSLKDLQAITATIGDFSTVLMGSPGRVGNIRLSLAALNNTLLLPGEVFSFNGVVGERTVEKGYKPAPIILGESVVPGVGGGVCQTSSTLYNAVRRADLEIVERRIHSLAPSYIRHGEDATVAWPHTDFKFRNNRDTPVIVKGGTHGGRARAWILGVPEEE